MIEFDNPLIAAVRDDEGFENALISPVNVIFLLEGANALNLKEYVDKAHASEKTIFLHFDMLDGVGKDKCGMQFVKLSGADGIISTKTNIIIYAKEEGLLTVQRFFIVDSKSVHTAFSAIVASNPDFVEVMPGVMPEMIAKFNLKKNNRIIAGGLITDKTQVVEALKAGAAAISTGKKELWYI